MRIVSAHIDPPLTSTAHYKIEHILSNCSFSKNNRNKSKLLYIFIDYHLFLLFFDIFFSFVKKYFFTVNI